MKHFDAAVIGGGILGCFVARNLRRWNISTLLLEGEEDVCKGITRANSAIVYAGYDNRPGSLKAELTVRGNAGMEKLCRELDVPFSRCGSLLVSYDAASAQRLEGKLRHGRDNGVPGLELLSGKEAEAMEPMLRKGVVAALYAPSTGTVNPWSLGIAAFENALNNGARAMLSTPVGGIRREQDGYILETDKEPVFCRTVINCAGLSADKVQELAFPPSVRLRLDSAEFLVLDERAEKPSRIIFHQAQGCGKGITAIPCTEGNLLLSGVRRPMEEPFSTTQAGLQELSRDAGALLPGLQLEVIRSFGAVRPNPCKENGESLHDFCIEEPAPGFVSLIGIKTPGLTCANELGRVVAEKIAAYLGAGENRDFDPCRKAIPTTKGLSHEELDRLIREDSDYGQVLCQCQGITRAEVLRAVSRGATTVDGVKRRVGSGMGRCQGSRCSLQIAELLKEAGYDPVF